MLTLTGMTTGLPRASRPLVLHVPARRTEPVQVPASSATVSSVTVTVVLPPAGTVELAALAESHEGTLPSVVEVDTTNASAHCPPFCTEITVGAGLGSPCPSVASTDA